MKKLAFIGLLLAGLVVCPSALGGLIFHGLLAGGGPPPPVHTNYLYAVMAPDCPNGCQTYPSGAGYIQVYDMDNSFTLINTITLPTSVKGIREVVVDNAGVNVYIPNYGSSNITTTAGARLLKFNIVTQTPVYDVSYSLAAIDRGCLSSDESIFYAPSGENVQTGTYASSWYVIRTSDGAQTGIINLSNGAVRPHNTICKADKIYMSAVDVHGGAANHHSVTMYVTAGGAQTLVGNFTAGDGRVRPFDLDNAHNLIYVNLEDWVGFAVGNTSTGAVLYDSQKPPGYTEPGTSNTVNSHGIAVTPNGNKLYVADPNMGAGSSTQNGIEVWDVSGVRTGSAPVYQKFIVTTQTSVVPHMFKPPNWLHMSNDGSYLFADTGEVIQTSTDTVQTQLIDPNQTDGPAIMRSRFFFEIHT